ncbi:hypothetical protein LUZ60_000301 [Juncus effusus]|nr:hypothetical protein LUZ60_000301 [Juncus effusus]
MSSSSSSGVSSVDDSRSWRWLRARAKPAAEGFLTVPNLVTNEVLQCVESKVQEASQGLFKSDRYNDILSASIGKPEHPGRLRGHSSFATFSTVYGKGPRRKTSHAGCITQAELDDTLKIALVKQAEEFQETIRIMIEKLSDAPHLETSPQGSRPPTQGPTPCKLWVQGDEGPIFIAHGRLYPSGAGATIHNKPLLPDHVRVCIDSVLEGLAHVCVPCPVDETEYIGQMVGTYVAWPAHLVELPNKSLTPKKSAPVKKKQSDKVQSASSAVKRDPILDEAMVRVLNSKSQWLYTVLMSQPSDVFSFEIQFGEEVFGIDGTIVLMISDIVELFKDDWLNVSILQIFCMVCERLCMAFDQHKFLFLDPYCCSETNVRSDLNAVVGYLGDVMLGVENLDKKKNKKNKKKKKKKKKEMKKNKEKEND